MVIFRAALWRFRWLIFTLGLALIAAGFVASLQSLRPETVRVLALARDADIGDAVEPAAFTEIEVLADAVPPGAMRVGDLPASAVFAASISQGAVMDRSLMASRLYAHSPAGRVVIPVTLAAQSVEIASTPGAHIDVYSPADVDHPEATLLAEDAVVVGISQKGENGNFISMTEGLSVVYLAVPPQTAKVVLGTSGMAPLLAVRRG